MRILVSAAPLGACIAFVEAEPISLLIADEYVPLIVDGQPLNFRVDSGSARSFAIYGPSYEALMGRASCSRITSGCYFCPPDNPCDDILSRKRWKTTFGDGDEFEYVQHNVTLIIANKTVHGFKLGLAINYSTGRGKEVDVYGLVGLSFGLSGVPETFLEQLQKRQVISNLTYSIRADGQGPLISGNLTLDDNSAFGVPPLPLSRHARLFKGLIIQVWSLTLLGSNGDPLTRQRNVDVQTEHISAVALVDSGATALDVSDADFESMVKISVEALRRDCRKSHLLDTGQIIWEDPDTGIYTIKTLAVPYLPTLVYSVGEDPDRTEIRIQPEHYVSGCDTVSCQLDIALTPHGYICLGHPLFRAYDVKFDLPNYQLYLAPHGVDSASATRPRFIQPEISKLSLRERPPE
ncbi:hypothetical protein FOZ63_014016 [Perkinsus olseni]|uniref:Peptidase A1 domain-containing protein n=1 Tax=Perkinsus olseni TaxID=32597 RepID=A0A7J6TAT5_PEROL|nr:hypothetical protein FOZ63_014016 [Perkinsus olseni]